MKRNWIGTVIMVVVSLTAGAIFSQIWEQVQGQPSRGQPGGFFVEEPQVLVHQPAVLPKWCVDVVWLPPQPGKPQEFRAITIVDTEAKKIAIYHENVTTGQLWWLSTRNIQPDLMVNQFNATSPLPSEMMKEIQQIQGQSK